MALRTRSSAVCLTLLASCLPVAGLLAGAPADAAATRATTGATTGTVTVTGSGYGHGVGLSQYGALGMARAGADAVAILRHYYTGVDVAPVRDAVPVRVNVVDGGRVVVLGSTALDAGGGGWQVLPVGGAPVDLVPGDRVVVTPKGPGRLAVAVTRAPPSLQPPAQTLLVTGLDVQWDGTRARPGAATTLDVTARTAAPSRRQRSYRWGRLHLSDVGSSVEAVAELDLHSEYLRGIAEMPSSWPQAALQVQVIAARNYALVAAGTSPRPSCGGCQLWDDTRSQVYAGWSKESQTVGGVRYGDRWLAALAATQTSPSTGLGVLYQGRPVTAYFASSTGGRTRDAADVWGVSVPYLRSVDDRWSVDPAVNPGFARWTRSASVPRLRALFGLPDLATITVTSRDAGGAARVVTATSAQGTTRTLSGNVLRARLGLPGDWITSFTLPAPPTPAPPSPSPSSPPSGLPPSGPPAGPSSSPATSGTPSPVR